MSRTVIKDIKVDVDKCTGCRSCELACSAFHARPKYSSLNPARSRIRVYVDEINDVYVPLRGGSFAQAECAGRNHYTIDGKPYSECSFCRAACPSRDWFKEPDTGLPLACDMCEDTPPLPEPMCVQACKFGALTYEERQEKTADQVEKQELDIQLSSLADKFGLKKIIAAVARMPKKG
jgi:benzoyl-CoA reductase subunit BamC